MDQRLATGNARASRTRPGLAAGRVVALASLLHVPSACVGWTYAEIASGFDMLATVRPPLAEDGTVVAAASDQLLVGDGSTFDVVDLASHGLHITALSPKRPVRVRSEGDSGGDIVFVADRFPAVGCPLGARGAYRISTAGGALSTLFEGCVGPIALSWVGSEIGLSANGTVAFSEITNGHGGLHRGTVLGAVSVLHSGSGTFFNTGALDVNDAGRVAVQLEYVDGFAGGLMRGILLFDTPEQDKAEIDTAIEKLGVGIQPPLAINAAGTVAFSLRSPVSFPIGGTTYSFAAGVYTATPTLFNTPKSLTLLADLDGDYCDFGAVDINDAGVVAFEAKIDGELGCNYGASPEAFDGIFTGPDPVADAVVRRGDGALADHQFFDSVWLGEINNAGQVSFLTTYSEPLVDPLKVWRADP